MITALTGVFVQLLSRTRLGDMAPSASRKPRSNSPTVALFLFVHEVAAVSCCSLQPKSETRKFVSPSCRGFVINTFHSPKLIAFVALSYCTRV